MAQSISFKQWNKDVSFTTAFNMVSKYTDLGSADGKKSILGVILNIAVNEESTSTAPVLYNFGIWYRKGPKDTFRYLQFFNNIFISGTDNEGNVEIVKLFNNPIKNIQNIQLKITGQLNGDIGINDFGLIFRTYRESNVESLDE